MSIEALIEKDRWSEARALLRQALKREPRHHWLLTRMSLTYYEQRLYRDALKYSERAFAEAPECPLVLWDYAGALQMLERHSEALDLYARLVTRGVDAIAADPCGEGRARARGIVSDSHYRASLSLKAVGNDEASLSAFEHCLDLRGPAGPRLRNEGARLEAERHRVRRSSFWEQLRTESPHLTGIESTSWRSTS